MNTSGPTAGVPKPGSQITLSGLESERFIVRDIKRGGMGVVFILDALNSAIGRVALKTYQTQPHLSAFQRECELWMSVSTHPNIATVKWYGLFDKRPSLLLEWYPSSIAELCGRIDDPAILHNQIVAILRALAYSHSHGILHQDIKPSNILTNKLLEPALADFGLARALGRAERGANADELGTLDFGIESRSATICGTPLYMAPELLCRRGSPTIQSDMYSLGLTLYELITGLHPYRDRSFRAGGWVSMEPVRQRLTRIGAGDACVRVLESLLHPEPSMRATSLDDLCQSLGLKESYQPTVNRRVNAHIECAKILREAGYYDEALKALERHQDELANPHPGIVNALGSVHSRAGDDALAESCFRRAHEMLHATNGVLDGEVLLLAPSANLARCLLHRGEVDEARKCLLESWRWYTNAVASGMVDADIARFYPEFGWMMIVEGRTQDAAAHLLDGLSSKEPRDIDIRWLVYSLWKAGTISEHAMLVSDIIRRKSWLSDGTALCGSLIAAWLPPREKQLLVGHILSVSEDLEDRIMATAKRSLFPPRYSVDFHSIIDYVEPSVLKGKATIGHLRLS